MARAVVEFQGPQLAIAPLRIPSGRYGPTAERLAPGPQNGALPCAGAPSAFGEKSQLSSPLEIDALPYCGATATRYSKPTGETRQSHEQRRQHPRSQATQKAAMVAQRHPAKEQNMNASLRSLA